MVHTIRSAALAALAVGAVAATAAMSPGTASTSAPAADESTETAYSLVYKKALRRASVSPGEDMALSWALADGRIDPKENAQAHRRYADCMTESGYTPRFRESTDGLYVELPYLTVGDPARLDAAVRDCSVGTAMVSALYRIQLFNPRGLSDSRLVAVQCLAKEGLVSSTYSAEEFERNLIADKFPFDATAPEANDCLYGAGYAYFALDK